MVRRYIDSLLRQSLPYLENIESCWIEANRDTIPMKGGSYGGEQILSTLLGESFRQERGLYAEWKRCCRRNVRDLKKNFDRIRICTVSYNFLACIDLADEAGVDRREC